MDLAFCAQARKGPPRTYFTVPNQPCSRLPTEAFQTTGAPKKSPPPPSAPLLRARSSPPASPGRRAPELPPPPPPNIQQGASPVAAVLASGVAAAVPFPAPVVGRFSKTGFGSPRASLTELFENGVHLLEILAQAGSHAATGRYAHAHVNTSLPLYTDTVLAYCFV